MSFSSVSPVKQSCLYDKWYVYRNILLETSNYYGVMRCMDKFYIQTFTPCLHLERAHIKECPTHRIVAEMQQTFANKAKGKVRQKVSHFKLRRRVRVDHCSKLLYDIALVSLSGLQVKLRTTISHRPYRSRTLKWTSAFIYSKCTNVQYPTCRVIGGISQLILPDSFGKVHRGSYLSFSLSVWPL